MRISDWSSDVCSSDLGLAATARRLRAKLAVIGDEALYQPLKEALAGSGVEAAAGQGAVEEAASRPVDWTLSAIVGSAGLKPTMAAKSEEHTSELQSLMRISYDVFCSKSRLEISTLA